MKLTQVNGYSLILFESVAPHDLDEAKVKISELLGHAGRRIAINLESFRNIFSPEISLIVKIHKEVAAAQGELAIVNASEEVENVLRTTNVDRVIPIYRTVEEYEIDRDLITKESHTPPEPEMRVTCEGALATVILSGMITGLQKERDLAQALSAINDPVKFIEMDLANLGLVDSLVIGGMVQFAARFRKRGGIIACARTNRIIRDLFDILSLNDLFHFFPSLESARKFLNQKGLAEK